MLKGKTQSGFEYVVKKNDLNNYELIEVVAEVDENPLLIPRVVKLLLGEDQKNRLLDHVRVDGIASVDRVAKELEEIFTSAKEVKNS